MRKWMKAIRAGLKHFIGARESIDQQKNLDLQFKGVRCQGEEKSRILSVMGMYAIHLDGFENDLRIEAVHCINF